MESPNQVSKSEEVTGRDFLFLGLLLFGVAVIAGELRGEYSCGYCDVGNPGDAQTQAFIAGVVNQDIEQWAQGDYVKITNATTTGEWTFTGASVFNLTDAYPADADDSDLGDTDPE